LQVARDEIQEEAAKSKRRIPRRRIPSAVRESLLAIR
jgi:hypothetical protein